MKRKLIVLTSTFPRWKDDTDPPFVFQLCKHLRSEFDIIVLTPHYPGARTKEEIHGLKVVRYRYFFQKFEKLAGSEGILPTLQRNKLYYLLIPFLIAGQFLALLALSKSFRPDIIHAHWILPQGLIATMFKIMTKVPFIVTAHGADIFGLRSRPSRLIKKFVLFSAGAVSVVSSALKKQIEKDIGRCDTTIEVLSMGVSSKLFNNERKGPSIRNKYKANGPLLLFVGRLSEKKGVSYLIDAMPRILKEFSNTTLLIIGRGEEEKELRFRVKSLCLDERIIFVGALLNHELPLYYASSDIFISPAIISSSGDTEGLGLTFVEAAMSGCLLIGTDVGGIRDIIQDSETGFLVPEKNSRALSEKIVYCLNHMNQMDKIRETARLKCLDKYDLEIAAKGYIDLLNNVANATPSKKNFRL